MQYLLTEKEYIDLKENHDKAFCEWVNRAHALLGLLSEAKKYPCTEPDCGYCNGCELEHTNICPRPRRYGK